MDYQPRLLKSGFITLRPVLVLTAASHIFALSTAAYGADPRALPTGGKIASGSGSITQSGSALTVNQSSNRLIANWDTFNIGSQASVNFVQPGASSIALNRVVTANPSYIYGSLTANGQVFLLNPSGVLFGPSAQVNVGGLVASTLGLSDTNFLNGRYSFANSGSAGSIVNQGTIAGGYVALLAPQVSNEGNLIATHGGTAAIGAGDRVTLDLTGDRLISLSVDQGAANALAENKGLIKADGGVVLMNAQNAGDLMATVVNNSGIVQARALTMDGGRIILDGGTGGVTQVSGTLDASSASGQGGKVVVTGDKVGLFGTTVDASGATGGGTVSIGGGWQGSDSTIRNANAVVMDSKSSIAVDALNSGNGGTAALWSERYTNFLGNISAKGIDAGGNVETSSLGNLQAFGNVAVSASSGKGGQWLIDPNDLTIVAGAGSANTRFSPAAQPSSPTQFFPTVFDTTNDSAYLGVELIRAALTGDLTVIIRTRSAGTNLQGGDITLAPGAALDFSGKGTNTLQLYANRNIYLNDNIGAPTGVARDKLDLYLSTGIGGTASVASGKSINTNGGSLKVNANGGLHLINGTVDTKGGSAEFYNADSFILNGSLNAGTGNIYIGATNINTTGNLTGGRGSISATQSVNLGGANSFTTGNVSMGAGPGGLTLDGPDSTFGRDLYIAADGAISIKSNVTATGKLIVVADGVGARSGSPNINGSFTLASGKTLSGAGMSIQAASLDILGNLNSTSSAHLTHLIETATNGHIAFGGTNTFAGDLIIDAYPSKTIKFNANDVSIQAPSIAILGNLSGSTATLKATATDGYVKLTGDHTFTGAVNLAATGSGGSITLDGGDSTFGSLSVSADRGITIDGKVTTKGSFSANADANNSLNPGSAFTLTSGKSIDTSGGDLSIQGAKIDILGDLTAGAGTLTATAGNIALKGANTFTGAVSMSAAGSSGSISLNGADSTFGSLVLNADRGIAIETNVTSTGNINADADYNDSKNANSVFALSAGKMLKANGALTVSGYALALGGMLNSGIDGMNVIPDSGETVGVGLGTGTFSVSTDALTRMTTTGNLTIGGTKAQAGTVDGTAVVGSGDMVVAGVTPAHIANIGGSVRLMAPNTGANITFAGADSTFRDLRLFADRGINIDADLTVATLSARADTNDSLNPKSVFTLASGHNITSSGDMTVIGHSVDIQGNLNATGGRHYFAASAENGWVNLSGRNDLLGPLRLFAPERGGTVRISGGDTTVGPFTIQADRGITVDSNIVARGNFDADADLNHSAHAASLFTLSAGKSVTTYGGGKITLSGYGMSLNGELNSSSGGGSGIAIVPNPGQAVSVGVATGSGSFHVPGSALANMKTSGFVVIGGPSSGSITVNGVAASDTANIAGGVNLAALGSGAGVVFSGAESSFANGLNADADKSIAVNTNLKAKRINANADWSNSNSANGNADNSFTLAGGKTIEAGLINISGGSLNILGDLSSSGEGDSTLYATKGNVVLGGKNSFSGNLLIEASNSEGTGGSITFNGPEPSTFDGGLRVWADKAISVNTDVKAKWIHATADAMTTYSYNGNADNSFTLAGGKTIEAGLINISGGSLNILGDLSSSGEGDSTLYATKGNVVLGGKNSFSGNLLIEASNSEGTGGSITFSGADSSFAKGLNVAADRAIAVNTNLKAKGITAIADWANVGDNSNGNADNSFTLAGGKTIEAGLINISGGSLNILGDLSSSGEGDSVLYASTGNVVLGGKNSFSGNLAIEANNSKGTGGSITFNGAEPSSVGGGLRVKADHGINVNASLETAWFVGDAGWQDANGIFTIGSGKTVSAAGDIAIRSYSLIGSSGSQLVASGSCTWNGSNCAPAPGASAPSTPETTVTPAPTATEPPPATTAPPPTTTPPQPSTSPSTTASDTNSAQTGAPTIVAPVQSSVQNTIASSFATATDPLANFPHSVGGPLTAEDGRREEERNRIVVPTVNTALGAEGSASANDPGRPSPSGDAIRLPEGLKGVSLPVTILKR